VYADRLLSTVGRLGPRLAMVTLLSCVAFLALPWIAPVGSVPLFIALTALWSATSSALRAPPLALLGKHAAAPRVPWMAGLYLFGVGAAGAIAPYLGGLLKGVDPRIPFAVSSIAVVVVTLVLAGAERQLAGTAPAQREWRFREAVSGRSVLVFAIAIALLAAGFQIHFPVNSAPAYLKHAKPEQLETLMPVFWIGFNLVMLPATILTRHFGGLVMMAIATACGVAATYYASQATDLGSLIALQFIVGGAWGVILMSACTAAVELGRPGREGAITGLLFSMLAVAAFARIWFTGFLAPTLPEAKPLLPIVPAALWGVALLVLLVLALGRGRRSTS